MKLRFFLGIFAIFLNFWGCKGCVVAGNTSAKIKLGVIGGPESELWEYVKTIAQKKHGLTIDLVIFNDYMTPNIALNDKSIDANAFQHSPYLHEMVKTRGLKLESVGKTFIFPLAAYSKKLAKINDLKDGAQIAIPNDPTNEGRALLLLHSVGLIELRDSMKLLSLPSDISKNPLNLNFLELDAAQLPRVLEDVDFAIINTTFASAAGLYPRKDALFLEGSDSQYVNIIAVRAEDQSAPWVKKLLTALQNDQIASFAEKLFQGSAIPGWSKEVNHD
jgi:D-methionine transport system substrate-binding protein